MHAGALVISQMPFSGLTSFTQRALPVSTYDRFGATSTWHRRLLLSGFAILTGPGVGRLLPMPLMIPNAWIVTVAATFIFPLIGMAADWRRDGRIHPAYLWGTGIYAGVFALSMLIAYSPLGYAFTDMVVSGTPGAERPMEAFLPAGFSI